ncbi:MAG TPA: hypothetical protein VID27_19480, partial [Blastocatellia bacterium]
MSDLTTHLSDDEIVRYSARRMLPVELLAADRHLSRCDKCYARMQESQSSDPLLLASKAFRDAAEDDETHLTYEQLVSLADDKLDEIDREIVQSHLEFCESCEAELNDLREVKAKMTITSAEERAPRSQAPFREKFLAFWRLPALRAGALSAAALAALALMAFFVSLPIRRENAALQARVAELEQRNEALKEQAERVEEMQNEIAALREENDRLRLGESSALVLNDGGARITLDEQGNLSGLAVEPSYESLIKEALQSGRVKINTPLTGSATRGGTLMGDPANPEFRLLAPVNRVIETDRPTFRWQGLSGVATFKVTVFDENLNKAVESETLINTEWTPSSALRRGQTYIWQVRASANNQEIVAPTPAAGRVKFKVLEQAKVDEIERAKKAYAKSHL